MLDPTKITNFNRSNNELEEFILFCICVAGKNALTTAKALDRFLNCRIFATNASPFAKITLLDKSNQIEIELKKAGIGQQTRITKAFKDVIRFAGQLHNITVDELETVHGVGPKTSRFFVLHSQKKAKHAVIDTHMTKYLKEKLGLEFKLGNKKLYVEMEQVILNEAKKFKMKPADFDLMVWNHYSGNIISNRL